VVQRRRGLGVLLPQRTEDIVHRKVLLRQFQGVEPDPHPVIERADDRRLPHAVEPGELRGDVGAGVIRKKDPVETVVQGKEVDRHEDVRRGDVGELVDGDDE
jgi:hypothetical protein